MNKEVQQEARTCHPASGRHQKRPRRRNWKGLKLRLRSFFRVPGRG